MYFTRTCYGTHEEVKVDIGYSTGVLTYKEVKRNARITTYAYDFDNGIPYIKRYGKKFSLEGFVSDDPKAKGLTLGAYLQKKKNLKKPALYSFLDFKQFIYMNTCLCEQVVSDCVLVAKNLVSRAQQEKSELDIGTVIDNQVKLFDPDAVVFNGFNAKRIR